MGFGCFFLFFFSFVCVSEKEKTFSQKSQAVPNCLIFFSFFPFFSFEAFVFFLTIVSKAVTNRTHHHQQQQQQQQQTLGKVKRTQRTKWLTTTTTTPTTPTTPPPPQTTTTTTTTLVSPFFEDGTSPLRGCHFYSKFENNTKSEPLTNFDTPKLMIY